MAELTTTRLTTATPIRVGPVPYQAMKKIMQPKTMLVTSKIVCRPTMRGASSVRDVSPPKMRKPSAAAMQKAKRRLKPTGLEDCMALCPPPCVVADNYLL